jgi:hypothetical protein
MLARFIVFIQAMTCTVAFHKVNADIVTEHELRMSLKAARAKIDAAQKESLILRNQIATLVSQLEPKSETDFSNGTLAGGEFTKNLNNSSNNSINSIPQAAVAAALLSQKLLANREDDIVMQLHGLINTIEKHYANDKSISRIANSIKTFSNQLITKQKPKTILDPYPATVTIGTVIAASPEQNLLVGKQHIIQTIPIGGHVVITHDNVELAHGLVVEKRGSLFAMSVLRFVKKDTDLKVGSKITFSNKN